MFSHTRSICVWLTAAAVACCTTASANAAENPYDELRAQDARLATVSERLLAENGFLCREKMALPGFALHSRDQYSDAVAQTMFSDGSKVAIDAVVAGSAAEQAGVRPDDTVLAIDGIAVEQWPRLEDMPLRDGAYELLQGAAAKQTLDLRLARAGQAFDVSLPVTSGCKALVEILSEDGTKALSDGRVIQVSLGLARRIDDADIAVVVAHELAHDILEHRKRLSAAGVSKGLLGELGSDQQLNRQAEVEADRLSVHLLANAGYSPQSAPDFWRSDLGRNIGGGLLRSRVYPSPAGRAELLEREIADYLPGVRPPSYPDHLLHMRDVPMK